jgi:NitT/TauT family transport system substrate-binding protein
MSLFAALRPSRLLTAFVTIALAIATLQSKPLKIGYSDWPGWVAWEVAIEKEWFKKAGVDVELEWFDYLASMDAFAAGKLDAVCMTNGDALLTGATGGANVMILINDFSNGNDMVVAAPGITSMMQLKGKKVGVEVGLVGHLLLLKGLESAGLTEYDVDLVNMPTDQAAQTLASGDVDAIVAWQPNSGQALKAVAGSTKIFSSADRPGLIYDTLAVSPESLSSNRAEWKKVVSVWYQIVDYIKDPKTREDAIAIMASRVDLPPAEYKPFLSGTEILTLAQAKKAYKKTEGFSSLYGSSEIVDAFSVANKMYEEKQDIGSYIDPSLTKELK